MSERADRVSARPEVIGLMPAAGRASRLGELPCSKEIFPVGFDEAASGEAIPRPVCLPLLRGWASAGIRRALVVLRDGKWDIPARLGDGREAGVDLAYLMVHESRSVPETLQRTAPWLHGKDVALGFPDILLEPDDVWSKLLDWHRLGGQDVSLGLFPTDQTHKADMVELDGDRITGLAIKQADCDLRWTWSIALWTPSFTRFLGEWIEARSGREGPSQGEAWVGDVIRSAIESGLNVRGLRFHGGSFLDVGTSEDLRRAILRG